VTSGPTRVAAREVHLERLIGRTVRDRDGRSAGAVEEIVVEARGDAWVVTEYLTGPAGTLERLASRDIGLWLVGLLGAAKSPGGYRIPWSQLDLSDPVHPRLRCRVDALSRVD
jgi:sporulation protein YlmC with PRC-barrel domain